MSKFLLLFIIAAMLAVLGALGLGLFAMTRGGDFNKKYGNKLMRARVSLQGVALALLALAYFTSRI